MGATERRLVTCVFIDVVGSTDVTGRIGPERMQRLLDAAFAEMSATIAGHGGTVEKYVGDAIFAIFGAPVTHADDAERALRAADACARWSSAPEPATGRLAVRIGIDTGEVLVDLSAMDNRQRIAVGAPVNTAARLQQQAETGEIVVGRTTFEATASVAEYEPLGTLALKGLGDVDAWRFVQFSSGPGAQPLAFVGRDDELRALDGAFDRAAGGAATLALIVGPPGQGKSRLASEAIRRHGGGRLLEARCRPGAETGLNTPLRQLVNAELPDATPDAVRDRLTDLLGADGVDMAAAICHSAGLAVDERLLALSRLEQRAVIADAWQRYLAGVARQDVLVVLIEDVHWADPVLVRIIDSLTSDVEAPILVIATARPEFVGSAHLRPGENRLQIDLGPLDEGAAQLLATLAADTGTVATRAAGNPLFIIELARSRLEADQMPVTIQAAIAARLDELSPSERELLQRASVAGETFDVRDAALLSDREPAEVAGALGRVAHLGFVAPVAQGYRFHHALVREVAYGRLPVAERMALHARYAVDGVDPADAEALAHHWWEAVKPTDAHWVWEDPARLAAMRRKGTAAHLAAGRRLEERNAYEEAFDVFTRALELADAPEDVASAEAGIGRGHVREGRGDEAWEHRLRAIELFKQAGAAVPGELYADMLEIATMNWGYFQHVPDDAQVLRLLDEGQRAAREAGDDVSLARLVAERAAFTNDLEGTDAITAFVESPDAVRFADAAHRTAQVYLWNGHVTRAVDLNRTVFERLLPAGAAINEPEALVWYALAAFYAGALAEADGRADRLMVAAANRSAHPRQHAYAVKALVRLAHGDWGAVTTTANELEELVDANPEAGFCLLGSGAAGYGAIAGLMSGRPLPTGLDAYVARLVPDSRLIQTGSVMVPKAMTGDRAALREGLNGYVPGLRLIDRQRYWDVCDLMPAIAMTILGAWDELSGPLARLDEFADGGGRLARAAAAAIREEAAAASGGPPPAHGELQELGYKGISQLLRFRPAAAEGQGLTAAS